MNHKAILKFKKIMKLSLSLMLGIELTNSHLAGRHSAAELYLLPMGNHQKSYMTSTKDLSDTISMLGMGN